MNLYLIPVALAFAAIDFQVKNPEINDGKDDDNTTRVNANTITRWSARDDGKMIIATTANAFPAFDKTTERMEVINLGKNLDGDTVLLATIQDSGKNLDGKNAEYEAKAFATVLPEAGSHFGTTAHADTSIVNTAGLLYVLDAEGKLKEQVTTPKLKRAFVAGAFDGKVTVAIETADRFGIIDAMTFVDRVRNDAQLVLDTEGKTKEEGEQLTRAELDEMMPVMAIANGKVAYYDQDANQLEKEGDVTADVIDFPGVDARGQQTRGKRVQVIRLGSETGRTERIAVGQR